MTWEELPIIKIQQIIGYEFKNKDLLRQAFTTVRYWYSKTTYNHDLLPYVGKAIIFDVIDELVKARKLTSEKATFIKDEYDTVCFNLMQQTNLISYLIYAPNEDVNEYQKAQDINDLFSLIVCAVYFENKNQLTDNVKKVVTNILRYQFKLGD